MTDPAIPSPENASAAGSAIPSPEHASAAGSAIPISTDAPVTDPAIPSPVADPTHLRAQLLDFFDTRARKLPWRETDNPYAIWVSEIMLQQTRVETVIPYWERWLDSFPDVQALAESEEADVLKLWEGLGYYSRARNLRKGAMVVRERFGGELPKTVEELRDVPGVGPYTAGAVASIAFGVAAPAVDGNVRRVLARLFDEPEPTPAWLRDRAAALLDPGRPGDFNQALMELGATVCTPRSPNCTGCPVATQCAACAAGTQLERPAPKKKPPVPHRLIKLVVVLNEMSAVWRVGMRKRPVEGLLGGLWEFPEWDRGDAPPGSHPLPDVEHTFSHFRATYRPFVARVQGGKGATGDRGVDLPTPTAPPGPDGAEPHEPRWIRIDEIGRLPLPVAQQRVAALVREWIETKSDRAESKPRGPESRWEK